MKKLVLLCLFGTIYLTSNSQNIVNPIEIGTTPATPQLNEGEIMYPSYFPNGSFSYFSWAVASDYGFSEEGYPEEVTDFIKK